MHFLGTVPTVTPPYEVITELRFSKQSSQHRTAQHKTFQWNSRRIFTEGDSISLCIIYWLKNILPLLWAAFLLTARDQRHICKFKHALPLLCTHSLASFVWMLYLKTQQTCSESQKILTEHIVVSLFSVMLFNVEFTEG